MSGLDELYGDTDDGKGVETAEVKTEVVEAKSEPKAEPQPSVQESQPQAQAAAQTQPAVDTQSQLAPIAALLEERDRRQAAEREAAELKAWRAEQQRKQQEARAQKPNMLDDPDGYDAWWEDRIAGLERGFSTRLEQAVAKERMQSHRRYWTKELGKEKFSELETWAQQQPQEWIRWANSQYDPFEVAHAEFDKAQKARHAEELTAKLGGADLDAYVEKLVAERLAAAQAQTTQAPAASQASTNRAPNGQFTSPPKQQRHVPSLSQVNGAAAVAASEPGSALDRMYPD